MINSTKSVKHFLRIALLFVPFAVWIGCSTNSPKATIDADAGSPEAEAVNANSESTKGEESFEVRDHQSKRWDSRRVEFKRDANSPSLQNLLCKPLSLAN
ncbi:MAG: hypothetical protein U0892_15585 [Pirellulales bacterium]